MSQFAFLQPEWPDLYAAARRAEAAARGDPRAGAFHARRWLELALAWLYRADSRLSPPWQANLAALLDEPTFRQAAGTAIYYKAVFLKDAGNRAVHSHKPFTEADARAALRELFHLSFWLVRTYAKGAKPPDGLHFDPDALPPPPAAVVRHTLDQLRALAAEGAAKDAALQAALHSNAAQDAQIRDLQAQVAAALAANAARPDTHDYDEAATRDLFIDKLLREAGWDPQAPGVAEVPLDGLPTPSGKGRADYVLWGADGKPLAVVEAKATRRGALAGQQQAKLYADALERRHGQRPVIFCTNGYEHWIWDDLRHPPREVAGFYRQGELELLVQRRTTRRRLADTAISGTIVERHYQTRAIRRVAEAFEAEGRRKALLVMATGAGKTRTVIALVDLLMRCNWAKRVLFLADRTQLVTQAVNAFKAHLPEAAPVNLQADRAAEGRVYVATYPTMLNLMNEIGEAGRRFGPGCFDLVVVDEAHRSIYRRYRAVFRWFDAPLVGLTATPKDEVDRNTYGLFDLEAGVPTDAYPLEEGVADGFLVPMRAVSVPTRFLREGIRYADLPEAEREDWESRDWGEDGPPDEVDAPALNQWLFNADTVDKVLRHLMTHGQKVEGGDRLGKTIIFARNHKHAEFIQRRFDVHYPGQAGRFARVIDNQVEHAPSLIEAFSDPARAPHIAVSVDMLDTGLDVPEVVNLLFFKPVRSRTKFWQMVGRGTRLRPDLFGPGQHKRFFYVFDVCGNLEFFTGDAATVEGSTAEPLSAKLFRARLDLLAGLDARLREGRDGVGVGDRPLRGEVAAALCREVAAMNPDNFIVRPHRRVVERFAQPGAWEELGQADRDAMAADVAGLPGGLEPERVEAKGFDLLLLGLQLGVLTLRPGFDAARERLVAIAGALAGMGSIPAVAAEMPLILEVQGTDWWDGVTAPELDRVRRRLRGLVHLIRHEARAVLYTDFADEAGVAEEVVFSRFVTEDSFARFRDKARQFFRAHEDHIAVQRLRRNQPLTPTDLAELERMLLDSGTGTPAEVDKAKEGRGLGLFVRSLVGLDRAAAQEALAAFLGDGTLTASQIEFLQILVENLTSTGVVDPGRLYEAPYTRFSAQGVEGVFPEAKVDALVGVLRDVEGRAVA